MNKQFIKYLVLPKGIKSIFFKSYAYLIPLMYFLFFSKNYWKNLLYFLFIFFLFEFIINPARYQLNDLIDYKEDQQRKHHWQRPVDKENLKIVLIIAITRFLFGTIIAFSVDIKLGYLAILFLALQIFYDLFAKKHSSLLAIFTISIAYPLRSLTILFGFKINFDQTIFILLLSIFLYATYMVFQWRRNESLFILNMNLAQKPHSTFFCNPKIKLIIFINLLLFLTTFNVLIVFMTKSDKDDAIIIYALSLTMIIMLSLFEKNIFKILIDQLQNILIVFIFIILTFNKLLIILVISVTTIFITFWYHKIYIEKFAEIYFNKNHHEKK